MLDPVDAPHDAAAIKAFCGDCHLVPQSHRFDKGRWREEVEQGFRLYANSGRDDLVPPDFDATLAFFRDTAPDELEFHPHDSQPDTRFQRQEYELIGQPELIGISNVVETRPSDASASSVQFAMTDVWTGNVSTVDQLDSTSTTLRANVIAKVAHPAHIEPADLDGDQATDFVVADLGNYAPDEQTNEGTLWMLRNQGGGSFRRHPLKLGLSRVASVRSLDHDGDGDVDLVVSDFGLHFVGSIYLLTNESTVNGIPKFSWSVLDDRPGAIDTPIVDFNGDGRPDIVTLVSQHHEVVDLHLNLGGGKFESHQLHQAPDPAYGSSSIEVVDLDADGDLDVVFTNGDTLDDFLAKPYHAIHWLENQGSYPFKHHQIATMPGVYCARTGDLDLDGDLDIVAVAMLGEKEMSKQPSGTFQGVIWLEQTSGGQFRRHHMLVNECDAMACQLLDWDADGDLDVLVPPANNSQRVSKTLAVYVNQTR
ncbi:VCBS repeat-containing protein [Roseiconus nitratireducens]|uniref:VCBS repeat-containing protein n=1 Tax=Roseiconus nitratireducens TaxID=2605748 RepID=A0A5M6CUG4_9BACT|nr:VCBS repeat-containing protein [Roseiconus nitratireducens]KAA5538703.1 VCBS repeat-containing protein [Roseiconus nitratireducens]